MVNIKNEKYLFWIAITGMVAMTVCILMGHNGDLIKTLIGLNLAGLGLGGYKAIKQKGGKTDGNKDEN